MSQNIVIYHKNCLDGTCAAWVASQYLPKNTTHIAVEYGKPLEHQMILPPQRKAAEDITLYILDWCPEMKDLDKCCELFGKVVLIDHHESAIKKLHDWKIAKGYQTGIPNNLELFLALNNEWSGAMGTAIWFHNNADQFKECDGDGLVDHWLVKAVDDRDRWQFKLPLTKEINEGLFNLGFDLDVWQKYVTFNEATKEHLAMVGTILIGKRNKEVQQIIESSAQIHFDKIASINCPYFLASEVGNVLASTYALAIMWYVDKEGIVHFSFRSNSKTTDWINCATLASKYNGGGHANAAGCNMGQEYDFGPMSMVNRLIEACDNIWQEQIDTFNK